jgi:hypothetical protein
MNDSPRPGIQNEMRSPVELHNDVLPDAEEPWVNGTSQRQSTQPIQWRSDGNGSIPARAKHRCELLCLVQLTILPAPIIRTVLPLVR